jgi:hypothetical protein
MTIQRHAPAMKSTGRASAVVSLLLVERAV